MSELPHPFPFDPTYGYDLKGLLAVEPPPEPPGFVAFWTERYQQALAVDPAPRLRPSRYSRPGLRVSDIQYRSTDGFPIRGWLLEPADGPVRRGFIVGHGYGGIERPDFELPCGDAAYLVPCFRGLSRSRRPPISEDPSWHVLHDIHLRERYILGGCVADLWTGISALLQIHGELLGGIGYMGISFGGGIGALALPWVRRIARAHLNVPTFGHQPLRLRLPTVGSGAAVQGFARRHLHVAETLAFFPVINVECSTVEDEPFYGEDENSLRACATGFNFSDVYARIDGKPVKGLDNFDVLSPLFSYTLPDDNVLGLEGGITGDSVYYGYYLMVPPLSAGRHKIQFGGTYADFGFSLDITYNLTVAPRGRFE